jgi:hypothetical protein
MGVRLGVWDGVPNDRFDFREERSRDKAELSSGSCDKTKEATHRTPGKEAIHEFSDQLPG